MKSLEQLMLKHLPEGGLVVPGARDEHMEIIEIATGQVWMSVEVATPEDFAVLELGAEYRPVGIGSASMDAALFLFSPNTESKCIRERIISGHRFINVAQPGEMQSPAVKGGYTEISVNKAHVLGFQAGSCVSVLHTAQGDFVGVVGTVEEDEQRALPAGERIEQYELNQHWIVPLPEPTRTLWWFEKGLRSFQGPVQLPADLLVLQRG
jgi:hypothetical protein